MKRWTQLALLLAAGLSTAGCVTDGAVRLARCVERGAYELYRSPELDEVRRQCDLRLAKESLLLAFPWQPVSSARLFQEGLTREEIDAVNALQDGPGVYARINVISRGGGGRLLPRASRTTYHDQFVDTMELLVCSVRDGQVEVILQRRGERPLWIGLEPVGR